MRKTHQCATSLHLINFSTPDPFAIGLSVPIWWGCWGQDGSRGWRQGSAFLLVAGSGGGTSAKVGKETTTVSVRWQLLLTLGIGLASSCSRLLQLAPTSPMESRALAFRQGRALSAHYSRCSCCWWPGKGWTDVGRDLGSNKSPQPQ